MKEKSTKPAFIFLTVWGAIQIMRVVAIPLIMDILNGKADPAWMFPAILDTVVGLGVIYFLYALWKGRSFASWMFAILLFSLSILDHLDGTAAGLLTVTPAIMGGPDRDKVGLITPFLVNTAIDVIAIIVLSAKNVRNQFFAVNE